MKIEAGKEYVARDGSITDVMGNTVGGRWPFGTYITRPDGTRCSVAWTACGEYIDYGRPHKLDLVKEYVEEDCIEQAIADAKEELRQNLVASMYGRPIQSQSYVQQLAAKHLRPVVSLLNNDPAFAEAAAKLSEMLAHALLEGPSLVLKRRKKPQSVMLWNAACILLGRAGIGIAYNDDELVLRK
jgi:hypothetical protein